MAAFTPSDRRDLNRAARIITVISLAGPAIAELLHPWAVRFPAIGAAVAAIEVLWSTYARQRAATADAQIPRPGLPPDDFDGPP